MALAVRTRAARIGRCRGALYGQSYPDGAVAVVDSGSTDGSRDLIEGASPGLFLYLLPRVMLTEVRVGPYLPARHPRRVPCLPLAPKGVPRPLPSCLANGGHIRARRRVPGAYTSQFLRGF